MSTRGLLICRHCQFQVSVTAGTIFQDIRKPLTLWFRAVWWITSQKNGTSALGIQRIMGLGSYQTAWTWLHKLRRAMVRPDRDRLAGRIEVDETFIGGLEEGHRGRGAETKALVIIAAQEDGAAIGRIRLRRISTASRKALHGFITDTIEPNSVVRTDGLNAYRKMQGYQHELIVVRTRAEDAITLLPRVHRVASLLKRWLLGTHQGAVSSAHLDYYLDEFTFRFNRRHSASRGKLFFRLMQNAVNTPPAPYSCIIKRIRTGPDHNR
jgi:transposase-like protein